MYSLIFIAKNNMKKKKGNVAVLLFLVTLATLLLYVSISLLANTGKVLEQAHDTNHTADFFYISPSKEEEKLTEIFTGQKEVQEFEKTGCLLIEGATYRRNAETDEKTFGFIFESMDEERKICKIPTKWTQEKQYHSILLPYYLKADGSFCIGDTIYLTLGNKEYTFEVLGFVEDPLFATPTNVSMYKCYITDAYMQDILNAEASLENARYQQYKVRLKDGESSYSFDEKVYAIFTREVPDLANHMNMGASWEAMKDGVSMLSGIAMGIVLVFSILLILIALIIVQFSVRNFIEENMKSIGVLQACGYTSGQLQLSSLLEMTMIAAVGVMIGLVAGRLLGTPVGNLQASMIGLSWNQPFDWTTAGIVAATVILLVMLTTCLISRKYGKITVLGALRGGIHIHNFRKNHFSLHKSPLPVSVSLGIKSILNEKLKNITILCIVVLMSFATCIGFIMYQNFALDTTNLLRLTGIELGTAYVTGHNLEQAGKMAEDFMEVEKVLYYNSDSVKITYGENQTTITCDMWSDPEKLENETVIEGRLPKYDNEIVLTTLISERLGTKVGDLVYVEGNGERRDYIVTGIDQKMNNLGLKAMLTLEGAKRLNGEIPITILYVFVRDGYSYRDLQKKLETFADISIYESAELSESSLSSTSMGMELLCMIFVIVTAFVVAMVVMLLVKTKMVRERKNYGVYKAHGFTTWHLIVQTTMSNLPVIFSGSVLGVVLAVYLANPLIALCLSFCGIKQCDMAINPLWTMVTVIGIVFLAAVVSLLSSLKIRKIEPVKMLVEE